MTDFYDDDYDLDDDYDDYDEEEDEAADDTDDSGTGKVKMARLNVLSDLPSIY